MLFFILFIGLPLLWVLLSFTTLLRNYLVARRTGLPLVVSLGSSKNPLWVVLSQPLQPYMKRFFPRWFYDSLLPAIYGWEFQDKYAFAEKVGKVFILVTPGENEIWIADERVALSVLSRRKEYIQLQDASKFMSTFGPNVLAANGDPWSRQRRLIAPQLNERISSVVWSEASRQAQQMAEWCVSQPNDGATRATIDGLRVIAINTLGQAAYGQSAEWETPEKDEAKQVKVSSATLKEEVRNMSLFDVVAAITNVAIAAIALPPSISTLSFMPDYLRRAGFARNNYHSAATALMDRERKAAENDTESRTNLLSLLIRLQEQGAAVTAESKSSQAEKRASGNQYLSKEEVQGNIFVFTVAGFDTTANTLAYAITLLAVYPQWRDWIAEEVDLVFKDIPEDNVGVYDEVFPRLTRCLALMFETLRLYPATVHHARSTQLDYTTVNVSSADPLLPSASYMLPPASKIYINVSSIHSDPTYWGPTTLFFNPSRWLPNSTPGDSSAKFLEPRKGTFMPWSSGPRQCPGMKMAQVEFVAVVAGLLRGRSVEPVLKSGETADMARERLLGLMDDSTPRLTLQMNRPRDVELRWTRR